MRWFHEGSAERGARGENYIVTLIKETKLFERGGKVLQNVYIPNENGFTTEADDILITRKGIFVFEYKNVSGWIFGKENDRNWTESISPSTKYPLVNPVMQNRTHIKWLKHFLEQDVFCYSVIVFSSHCQLKNVIVKSSNTFIVYSDHLIEKLDRLERQLTDKLSDEQVKEIYRKLVRHSGKNVPESVKQKHKERIQIGFLNSKENPNTQICPRCGSALVLRTAKKGDNAGKQFYGCSAFPKCRYIKNTEESECNSK